MITIQVAAEKKPVLSILSEKDKAIQNSLLKKAKIKLLKEINSTKGKIQLIDRHIKANKHSMEFNKKTLEELEEKKRQAKHKTAKNTYEKLMQKTLNFYLETWEENEKLRSEAYKKTVEIIDKKLAYERL